MYFNNVLDGSLTNGICWLFCISSVVNVAWLLLLLSIPDLLLVLLLMMKPFVTFTVPDVRLLSLLSHRWGLVRIKSIKRVDETDLLVQDDKKLNNSAMFVFHFSLLSASPLCVLVRGEISLSAGSLGRAFSSAKTFFLSRYLVSRYSKLIAEDDSSFLAAAPPAQHQKNHR